MGDGTRENKLFTNEKLKYNPVVLSVDLMTHTHTRNAAYGILLPKSLNLEAYEGADIGRITG